MGLAAGGVDLVCCVRNPPTGKSSRAPVTHLGGGDGRAVRACHDTQYEPTPSALVEHQRPGCLPGQARGEPGRTRRTALTEMRKPS